MQGSHPSKHHFLHLLRWGNDCVHRQRSAMIRWNKAQELFTNASCCGLNQRCSHYLIRWTLSLHLGGAANVRKYNLLGEGSWLREAFKCFTWSPGWLPVYNVKHPPRPHLPTAVVVLPHIRWETQNQATMDWALWNHNINKPSLPKAIHIEYFLKAVKSSD